MLTKSEAQSIAANLLACPFCGEKLVASIRGNGGTAVNPKAKCETEDCMGSKLPVIGLDVASQVHAWNTRAQTSTGADLATPQLAAFKECAAMLGVDASRPADVVRSVEVLRAVSEEYSDWTQASQSTNDYHAWLAKRLGEHAK